MVEDESITHWIAGLKQGDAKAADQLWERYFSKLIGLARHRLSNTPRRVADEEDITVSVFRCLCSGAEDGKFQLLTDRDDLWRLLVKITARKTIDQQRRLSPKKRGDGKVRGESVFANADFEQGEGGLDQFASTEPTPEFLNQIWEEHGRLVDKLNDDVLRKVVQWRMEGFTNEEIATKLKLTPRSIERKLNRIREIWRAEI